MKNKKVRNALLIPLLLGALAGCHLHEGEQSISADKTQLYVGVYTGELDSGSFYQVASEFEKKYADVSFEEGKKGLEVVFSDGRFSDTLKDTILDGTEEVFLDTAASSLHLSNNNLLLDLSDLYNTPMNKDLVSGATDSSLGDNTFYQLVRANRRDLYQGSDGGFYGVPGYSQYYGIVYDIDLFEEKNLYFAENGSDFVSSNTAVRSAGPDGKKGTSDDGLPATYEDYFKLCDKIVSLGMTPIMWGGTVQEYVNSLLSELAANYDGKEETELNYNYNGTTHALISFDPAGQVVVDQNPTAITAENGYELYRQGGRYYALKFLEQLVSNKSYYNYQDATSLSFSNKDAQEQFLFSKRSKTRKRTAMLVEGSWWFQEATGTFLSMAAEYGEEDSQASRRLGFLPLPKATSEKVGEPFTLLERSVGDGFIKKNIAENKKKAALSFLQYLFQKKSYTSFLTLDGETRAVDYDLSESELEGMDYWSKNIYDLQKNAVVATMYSNSKIMQNYPTQLWYSPNVWKSTVSGTTYDYPSTAMINAAVTAKNYFLGHQAYWTEGNWQSVFQNV